MAVSDDVASRFRQQIEFYLSDANLRRDRHMRWLLSGGADSLGGSGGDAGATATAGGGGACAAAGTDATGAQPLLAVPKFNSTGWVPLGHLASFGRMRALAAGAGLLRAAGDGGSDGAADGDDTDDSVQRAASAARLQRAIRDGLASSLELKLSDDGERVRRRRPLPLIGATLTHDGGADARRAALDERTCVASVRASAGSGGRATTRGVRAFARPPQPRVVCRRGCLAGAVSLVSLSSLVCVAQAQQVAGSDHHRHRSP